MLSQCLAWFGRQKTSACWYSMALLDPLFSSQLYALHTPPRRIEGAARDAGAKRLLLSHVAPDVKGAS